MIKICACCKKEKEIKYFHKNKSQPDGLHHTCKLCRTHQTKEYSRKNRHILREKNKINYLNNKEARKQLARQYYYDNKDKVLKTVSEYGKNNRNKTRAINMKRRARKLLRTPNWLTKEQFLEIESFYEEAVRLTKSTGIVYHVDHIIPLKGDMVSGLHVPWNLQVITAIENLSKSNKLIESYL